ncbi:hypothetical protein GT755_36190 [Herbidospora sp. NEAU-GS84]|uniref:VWA domain-containing protein n=1 Tax=Herbidospora solisilvae TaxID=2696284 RepID=A0A7C9NJP9_9ACTN|nr:MULTISPECIES: hypothetical protein [Herbidospora]NAS27095.1 hypothetical protein [Herbidospora solisilvae]GLX93967.1 hypothetical protein Hesp01_19170 [Herbidospora sp. NBRC 101105]
MGWGHWSDDEFEAAQTYREQRGLAAFGHSEAMRNQPRHTWRVHQALDPYNVKVREARDSQEHPESVAVAVFFDVTGSMQRVPRELQVRLPSLLSTVTALIPDAQILFGAVGDATCDRAPLQIGQFESDNRMDEDLRRILLEGGGGGGMRESYELALYFLARHTALDCHEKRGVKGVAFVIGDEMPYPSVSGHEVAALFGESMVKDVRTETVIKEASRTWDINMIIPGGTSHAGDQQVSGLWRTLLGDRVIELDDVSSICDTIALTVVDRVMSQKAH